VGFGAGEVYGKGGRGGELYVNVLKGRKKTQEKTGENDS